jgi:hypothetical protein
MLLVLEKPLNSSMLLIIQTSLTILGLSLQMQISATSNVKDPTVTFSSPGWKTITLKAENANGSNSYTSTEAVYIQTGDALPEGPYFEAFNSSSVVNDWIGFNYDRNNSKWSYAANTGKGGNGCMKVELYKSLPGDIDEIITPVMDLNINFNSNYFFRLLLSNNESELPF